MTRSRFKLNFASKVLPVLGLLGSLFPLPASAHDAGAGPVGQFFTSFPLEAYVLLAVGLTAGWVIYFSRRRKNGLAWSSLALVALLNIWTFQQTGTALASIASVQPNGGECIKGNTPTNIQWTNDDGANYSHAYASYSTASGTPGSYGTYQGNFSLNLIGHPIGPTSHSWTTPSTTNSTMRVYVESHDGSHAILGSTRLSASDFGVDADLPTATTVSSTGKTATSVSLSWTASTDAGCMGLTGYKITRNGTEIATGLTGTTHNDINLSASTAYAYVVTAYDTFGSTASNTLNITTDAAGDTTAPAAITTLATGTPTSSGITVTWTAPGDDGSTGTATSYDLRYSTSTINDANFANATPVNGEPAPQAAGTSQSMTVTGLSASTTYFFAMKTQDEVPNVSALSNVASATTTAPPDTTAPAAITTLAASSPTTSTVTVTWTAPGDDGSTGTATSYDIRYSTSTIGSGNFASATPVTGEPSPQVAGTSQSMVISGLSSSTTYSFAMQTSDEVPNVSALSNVTSATTSAAPSGGGGTTPASVNVSKPNGGETLNSGTNYQLLWGSGGSGIQGIRLTLSTDSGATFPTTISTNEVNDGVYDWMVPATATTKARIKIEALGQGGTVLASDTSNADFTITVPSTTPPPATTPPPSEPPPSEPPPSSSTGTYEPVPYTAAETAAPAEDPNTTGTYSPSSATTSTPTIDVDKGLVPPPPETLLPCQGGTLIKLVDDGNPATTSDSTVYYCGKNGKRYYFPNQSIFFTWYADFKSVKTMTPENMAKVQLGGNVTYKPGVKMVKITTDPKVYAIARAGLLRWVQNETVAASLYGARWNRNIDDVPDSFFFNYQIGDPIE